MKVNEKRDIKRKLSVISYAKQIGNVCRISLGEFSYSLKIENGELNDLALGRLTLDPGAYELAVKVEIMDGELMRLRNIKLASVK